MEHAHPGITYELVMGLVRKADMSVNMNESILRLQVQTHILTVGIAGKGGGVPYNIDKFDSILLF